MVRVDLTMHREALRDEDVEQCVDFMRRGVTELAKRCEFFNGAIPVGKWLVFTVWDQPNRVY